MLLNSAIDVETPAHMSAGFTALVYVSLVGKKLKFPILIHGRYHKPSLTEENFQLVQIELPNLMFKADNCALSCFQFFLNLPIFNEKLIILCKLLWTESRPKQCVFLYYKKIELFFFLSKVHQSIFFHLTTLWMHHAHLSI